MGMNVLFTGASSPVGGRVLRQMLQSGDYTEIWCARHRAELEVADKRLRVIDLDLTTDFDLQAIPGPIDLVVHFAALTHASRAGDYFQLNLQGTSRLARAAQARGCRRFVYASTRCAMRNAGAYGESKLAAEEELQKFDWQRLLIIRPAEVYGGGGREGVDQLITLARNWHVAPLLFGDSRIEFAPLHIDDFAAIAAAAIADEKPGATILEVCGPEDLSGPALARALARRFSALPVPVWWPLLAWLLKMGRHMGLNLTVPDQTQRLTSPKTSSAGRADAHGNIRL